MPDKIYLVTALGCHVCGEGLHILGVFSTEERAKEVADAGMYGHTALVWDYEIDVPWIGYRPVIVSKEES